MNVSNKNSKITSAASKYEYIPYELVWKKRLCILCIEPMDKEIFTFISIALVSTYCL